VATYAIPATRGELDALKGNLEQGFGNVVTQVAARNPQIQAAYDQVAQQIRADAAARTGRDAEAARQQQAGMAAAAQSLGVQPVMLGENSRAGRLASVLSAQYNGNSGGWKDFLGTMGTHAVNRNQATADAFGESGRVMRSDMERQFQEYLASLYAYGGGGGGGGRGGKNYDDEDLIEFPKVAPMTDGVKRGLAATSIRLDNQGRTYQSAGLLSRDGSRYSGPTKAPSHTSTRRGGGGSFSR
jgi:hypothetical protein